MEILPAAPLQTLAPDSLSKVVAVLQNGEIIAYPTETFYALGIDPDNGAARQKLYRVKRRPAEKELPLIAADREMVEKFCDTSHPFFSIFADHFWPGPLTLVLVSLDHKESFAVRISSHPIARQISKGLGHPVVSTSANFSGSAPASDPRLLPHEIQTQLQLVIDAGLLPGGLPSTVVSLLEPAPKILRQGAIPSEQITGLL